MKNHRFIAVSAVLLAALCLLTGCAAKSAQSAPADVGYVSNGYNYKADTAPAMEAMTEEALYDSEAAYDEGGVGGGTGLQMPADSRKIILTASVDLESKEYDTALQALLRAVEAAGGYVADRNDYDYGDERSAELQLRVPSGQYAAFINGLSAIANQTRLSQNSEDVTESYIETESYLKSLTTQQDRLLELMSEAEDLESILKIEDRLANVRAQLQYYASLKNNYDNRISYATVSVYLREVKVYTVTEYTFGQRLADTIRNSWEDLRDTLGDILNGLLYLLPWLLLLVLPVVVILLLIRRGRAKKAARRHEAWLASQNAETEQHAQQSDSKEE